jgi:hypothetical protein
MDHTKSSIRQLITQGKLEAANAAALEYAEYSGLSDIANALTVLGSRAQDHHEKWSAGLISYEAYSRAHAQITHSLTDWVDRLPDEPTPGKKRRRLLTEATFKKRLFYLLCLIKVAVILRLSYHWSTGGFSNDQFQGTVALLAPALAAYISVMVADYLRQHHKGPQPPRYISGPLVTFSYFLMPIYGLLLLLFIELKAKTVFSFAEMNTWLALVESVLGAYVGQIVFAFFRKGG